MGRLTGSGNREGALDGAEFLVGDERGVGRVADVNLAGLQEAGDVLKDMLGCCSCD